MMITAASHPSETVNGERPSKYICGGGGGRQNAFLLEGDGLAIVVVAVVSPTLAPRHSQSLLSDVLTHGQTHLCASDSTRGC